jgi:hypothetical protein
MWQQPTDRKLLFAKQGITKRDLGALIDEYRLKRSEKISLEKPSRK